MLYSEAVRGGQICQCEKGNFLRTVFGLNQQGKIFSLVFISQQVVSEPGSIVWVLWLVLV